MASILTVRIKAVDEATPIIRKVQNAAKQGAAGISSISSKGLGSAIMGGLAGGVAAGGIMAGFSMLQQGLGQIVDIGKRLWSVMSEASGYAKAVNKLWERAVLEIFRPLGDMVGMMLLPSIMDLNKITRDNYSEFIKNVQAGMSVSEAMKIAMDKNNEALATFLIGLVPVLEATVSALIPLVETTVKTLAPVIAQALIDVAPSIGAAMYQGLAQPGIGKILEGLGLKPNENVYSWNDVSNKSVLGRAYHGTLTDWVRNDPISPSTPVSINYYGPVYGKEDIETAVNDAIGRQNSRLQVI